MRFISIVFFSWFKKFKCPGDSVSLLKFATFRLGLQLLPFCAFFKVSSDFDLAQNFSCSVKTMECGQIVFLACQQLRKKVQHNFKGQL